MSHEAFAEEEEAAWSFDADDQAPATDTPGDTISLEDIERLEREQQQALETDSVVRTQAEMEEDEAGRQRRQNVRVNVKIPLHVVIEGYPNSDARSRDLSATGVGFATRLPLDVDTPGLVTVHFAEWKFTKDFVVRFVKPILSGRIVGVQFEALTEDERERVVREVFAVQRAQLQEQRARQKVITN